MFSDIAFVIGAVLGMFAAIYAVGYGSAMVISYFRTMADMD